MIGFPKQLKNRVIPKIQPVQKEPQILGEDSASEPVEEKVKEESQQEVDESSLELTQILNDFNIRMSNIEKAIVKILSE